MLSNNTLEFLYLYETILRAVKSYGDIIELLISKIMLCSKTIKKIIN